MRIIARLDVKSTSLIKAVGFEGLRKVGDPKSFIDRYYQQGIDELAILDSVASLYQRSFDIEELKRVTSDCFLPVVAGGGIHTVDQARQVLRNGADRIAVNTGLLKEEISASELISKFGGQAVIASIQTAKVDGEYRVFCVNGRELTCFTLKSWIEKLLSKEVSEILVTSMEKDGTMSGIDYDLVDCITEYTDSVNLVYSGGFKDAEDILELDRSGFSGVCIGAAFHYSAISIAAVKEFCRSHKIGVRGD